MHLGTEYGDWPQVSSAPSKNIKQKHTLYTDSLRGSSVKIGTIQTRLAWPLRKDDKHQSRSVNENIHFVRKQQNYKSNMLFA